MDWQLIVLPLILLALVTLSVCVKSWPAGDDRVPDHHDAMDVMLSRGGSPPGY